MKISDLSPRQQQILRLRVEGFSREAIALKLEISVRTVVHHWELISDKVGGTDVVNTLRAYFDFVEK